MSLERFSGPNLSLLLARAASEIGANAVVLSVKKVADDRGRMEFELIAADPETADGLKRGSYLTSRFPESMTSNCPPLNGEGRIVVAIVGPTGAGKTTTIAKLANHAAVFGTREVGFICLDTFRIGGIEQIKIFAALSRVPVETIYETKDIPRAIRRLRKCDVLLIDTPGRGPAQSEDAAAAQALVRMLRPDEVHLAIPAGLRPAVARAVIEAHRPFGVTHVLPTKVDECPEDPTLITLASELELPMRWMACGQVVPGDLRTARSEPVLSAGAQLAQPDDAVTPHSAGEAGPAGRGDRLVTRFRRSAPRKKEHAR
jgi:flagellar biosynthesis protein FlhF